MRKYKNLVIGGIENKIVNLILITILLLAALFLTSMLTQNKLLSDLTQETSQRQLSSMTGTTTAVIDTVIEENMDRITEMEARLTDEMFQDLATRVQMTGDYAKKLLDDPDTEVKGTVKELADKYGIDIMTMTGFLDGINESLKEKNPIETMEEDTPVSLAFDKEKLYKNMVDAKADWLYGLDAWKEIYSEEELKDLYREAKKMNTIVKGKKIGRNDPCPCGSGKKYKFCCGRNA